MEINRMVPAGFPHKEKMNTESLREQRLHNRTYYKITRQSYQRR